MQCCISSWLCRLYTKDAWVNSLNRMIANAMYAKRKDWGEPNVTALANFKFMFFVANCYWRSIFWVIKDVLGIRDGGCGGGELTHDFVPSLWSCDSIWTQKPADFVSFTHLISCFVLLFVLTKSHFNCNSNFRFARLMIKSKNKIENERRLKIDL